jgi:hypothetical protein
MQKHKTEKAGSIFVPKVFYLEVCGMLAALIAQLSCLIPNTIPTKTPTPIISTITPSISGKTYFVDGVNGNDANPGTESLPWQSIKKAMDNADAGDAVIVRSGEYPSPSGGWIF